MNGLSDSGVRSVLHCVCQRCVTFVAAEVYYVPSVCLVFLLRATGLGGGVGSRRDVTGPTETVRRVDSGLGRDAYVFLFDAGASSFLPCPSECSAALPLLAFSPTRALRTDGGYQCGVGRVQKVAYSAMSSSSDTATCVGLGPPLTFFFTGRL
jgi:hypothetical protein